MVQLYFTQEIEVFFVLLIDSIVKLEIYLSSSLSNTVKSSWTTLFKESFKYSSIFPLV